MQDATDQSWAGFAPKAVLFALILALEKIPLLHRPPSWLDQSVIWLGGMPVLFGLAALFFSRGNRVVASIQREPISYGFAGLHVGVLLALTVVRHYFFAAQPVASSSSLRHLGILWIALIAAAVVSLFFVFVPPRKAGGLIRGLGATWIYAAVCTAVIVVFRHVASASWDASNSPITQYLLTACFNQTHAVLKWFYPVVLAYPPRHYLGTPGYFVEVSWLCSGIEGLGLVAVLIVLWLFFTRRELRIGRALLIAPVALAATWLLNIARLAVLIAIGDAGHPGIASNGFHAQAGWISLNVVALGFLLIVQNVSWFRRVPSESHTAAASRTDLHLHTSPPAMRNPTVVYLLPFALISAASLVTQASTSGFEWLYPLRFIAALVALWIFRRHYRAMDWRFGFIGPLAGVAIAAMWIVISISTAQQQFGDFSTAVGLDHLTPIARVSWITIRVAAAVITVPIAEELAFRGFLARRVMSADFEDVPYARLSLVGILVSSAAFGAMHGKMWAAGIVSGLIFAAVAKLRGRIGEAVAAHAVANLIIAVMAVIRSDYSMW